jgi:hypothetical protein
LIIDSIKLGNIYALYINNRGNIILKITHIDSENGSVRGYDCFGIPTFVCIHCICGFGILTSFPRPSSKEEQNRKVNNVKVKHRRKGPSSGISLENVKVMDPEPLLDLIEECSDREQGIHEQKEQTYSQPLEELRDSETEPPIGIIGEKKEAEVLWKEPKKPFYSIEKSIKNNQANNNSLNNIKHDSIFAKKRNTLLSIKVMSINGNSIIEKSGGGNVE